MGVPERKIVEQNSEDTTSPAGADTAAADAAQPAAAAGDAAANTEAAPAAPTRRRTSRRVSAPAGEAAGTDAAVSAAAADDAPAATADSAAATPQAEESEAAPPAAKAKTTRTTRTTTRARSSRAAATSAAASAEAAEAVGAEATESEPAAAAAAPARKTTSRSRTSKAAAAVEASEAAAPSDSDASASTAAADAEPAAPKRRQSRARKKTEEVPAETSAGASADGQGADATANDVVASEATPAEAGAAASPTNEVTTAAAAVGEADAQPQTEVSASGNAGSADDTAAAEASADVAPTKRRTSRRGRKPAGEDTAAESTANGTAAGEATDTGADAERAAAQPADTDAGEKTEQPERRGGNGHQTRSGDSQQRPSRTRQRERKRRQGDDLEPEIAEDDVLLPIAGILDVLDNYAFVRTSGYLPGTSDVYVSLGQVKKYGLRKGDAVVGAIRQPRENENNSRQKYNAIVKIDSVNSRPVDDNPARPEFAELTPLLPEDRVRLETTAEQPALRAMDLLTPIGKGQRGLIVGPDGSGKSELIAKLAGAVAQNHPEAHLMVVVIDERPEEVTRLQRSVAGEVVASTFDRPAEDHATVAELSIERAKRLVELGHDVIVLIDSLTRLSQAYNLLGPAAHRQPAGRLDAAALYPVKKLLGAARNLENGGSLTIIGTAQAGAELHEIMLDELRGTANMELRLSGELARKQLYPAIDIAASATRHAELLVGEAEAHTMDTLRRSLAEQDAAGALSVVLQRLAETGSNAEFLALTQRAQRS